MAKTPSTLQRWTARRSQRIRGYNPWRVALDALRTAHRHRVIGLAAEMAFFASLALVPFTVAVGAMLGYSGRLLGANRVQDLEATAVHVMSIILSPGLVGEVAGPFVRAQFDRERGGLAVLAIAGGLWLVSRMFVPAVYGLDLAYGISDNRSAVVQRLIALALAVASLIVVTIVLVMLVVGPLLGSARGLAYRFRLGETFAVVWNIGRWPVVVLVVAAFLLVVYRYAPDTHMRWRTALPGAIVGVVLWLLLAIGFRLYLASGFGNSATASPGEEAVVVVSRTVGAIVATALWTFLSSLAVLAGGEVNAAVERVRGSRTAQLELLPER
jgi:membrane protein